MECNILNLFYSLMVIMSTIESYSSILKSKVVGGNLSKFTHMRYIVIVRLNDKYNHVCGGCLISKLHVLTAAHCIDYRSVESLRTGSKLIVTVGTNQLTSGGESYSVQRIDVEETFDPYKKIPTGDMGVLTLSKAINLINYYLLDSMKKDNSPKGLQVFLQEISLIQLPTYEFPVTQEVTVAGWGSVNLINTNKQMPQYSDYLKSLNYIIEENTTCEICYNTTMDSNQLCASPKNSEESLSRGDSGGPLFYNEVVIGIVSYAKLNNTGCPAIFTKVYSFINFIKKVQKKSYKFLVHERIIPNRPKRAFWTSPDVLGILQNTISTMKL